MSYGWYDYSNGPLDERLQQLGEHACSLLDRSHVGKPLEQCAREALATDIVDISERLSQLNR